MKRLFTFALLSLALSSARSFALEPPYYPESGASVVYPPNSGVLNVRDPEFGAKGDGVTDDTAAIQKALTQGLSSSRVVYLPDGAYLVSDTLRWHDASKANNNVEGWGPFLQLQGQSRAGTIIRLQPNAPGFGDAAKSKAVISTGSSGSDGNKHYRDGEGNEAFENHLRNFTVEVGRGNPGAVGIDYQVSNVGAMRHVSLKAAPGSGTVGINLSRRDNGPGLISDVSIEGFGIGARLNQDIAEIILENVTLSGQSVAGLWNTDGILGVRHLTSNNSVPAVKAEGASLTTVLDSNLSGGATGVAIDAPGNDARLVLQNIQTSGYSAAVKSRGQEIKGPIQEWISDMPLGGKTAVPYLRLPVRVRDTPEWYEGDPEDWAVVPSPSGDDDTKAVQKALDSGKRIVFFPYGTYNITKPLRVPGTVRRLQGTGTKLQSVVRFKDEPLLRFEGGQLTDLTIVDRFQMGGALAFEHADARQLVIRDILPWTDNVYRSLPGAGPLFIEDVSGAGYQFQAPGQPVWARQWDIEGKASVNNGASVWALGWKTESGETLIHNLGGEMELLAGFTYTFGVDPKTPAFLNENGTLVASWQGSNFTGGPNGYFTVLARDVQGDKTTDFTRDQALARGNAASVPLLALVNPNLKLASGVRPRQTTLPAATAPVKTAHAPQQRMALPQQWNTNPVLVAGKPQWALCQVWPDDITSAANYQPLSWNGREWVAKANNWGGQPEVKLDGGDIKLNSRAPWAGNGEQAGNKLAALVFTAPFKGQLSVTGTAKAWIWQSDGPVALAVLKLMPGAHDGEKKSVPITILTLPKDKEKALEDVALSVNQGDQVVFVAQFPGWYSAAEITLSKLDFEMMPEK